MSIAGYFIKNRRELRMPIIPTVENKDALGIRVEGPVLTGAKSVEQAHGEDEIRVSSESAILDGILSGKPRSLTPVGGLDPAQRNHLRRPGKF